MLRSCTARYHRLSWIISLFTVLMLLVTPVLVAAYEPDTGDTDPARALPAGAPPNMPPPSKPLHLPKEVSDIKTTTAKPGLGELIDVKILVIASDSSEADLPAIKQILDYLGEPYTVYLAVNTPDGLTPDKLTDPNNSGHAFYQGVILTTSTLVYNKHGVWTSALTQQEWTALADFEVSFGIRQVTWYTYPTPDYGFNYPSEEVNTTITPLSAAFTATDTPSGQTVFGSYANTATPVMIRNAYAYKAKPLADGNTQTLLQDGAGNALGVIRSYRDGAGTLLRQNLALAFDNLAFDSNPYVTHDLVLAYGLVNWVTKGTFLGERHISLDPQPDDVFIQNSLWPPGTMCSTAQTDPKLPLYRISDKDLGAVLAWQQNLRAQATTKLFTIEMPFNGIGTTATWIANKGNPPGQYSPDTLTPAVQANQAQFNWVSHTYDHANLDTISYEQAMAELTQNNDTAKQLGLPAYTTQALVTPEVSGLNNPDFLQAAYDVGIRYLVSDTSRPAGSNPSPNAGIYNSHQSSILQIPRHPTNLYFNVSTPQEWLAEDNCLYPPGALGYVDTYQHLLDRESSQLLTYLLKGDVDPLMFHQPNLRAYDATHTVFGDLLDATLAKYNALFTLPIQSMREEQIGQRMADRMAYNAADVTAQFVPGTSITVTVSRAATVPVTGAKGTCATCTSETYGGQTIIWVKLAEGQSVTLPLK